MVDNEDSGVFKLWEHKPLLRKEVPKHLMHYARSYKTRQIFVCLKQHLHPSSSTRHRGKSYNIRDGIGGKDGSESTLSTQTEIQPCCPIMFPNLITLPMKTKLVYLPELQCVKRILSIFKTVLMHLQCF